ncbi:T6SS effector phospholipase Tle3 domain-containing protein [Klebsiella michiganensis]|nr:hypothetical protein [Klebsiella michiganensis]MCW9638800.1 hypothetical protein [Klebsiella michiganensis]HDX8998788.1 hypothetical protein [Klebsiella michiganensis]
MTDKKNSPYAPRIASRNDVSVHKDLGEAAQTCSVAVPRPMPCIVILVHGVNDVGEAYQNQENGIIAGLSKRLNRTDLYAHEWKDFMMMHNEEAQKKIAAPGRSPVIPFYWGYKPVTYDDWVADQQNYRKEVDVQKLGDKAHIPYDAYQQNDKEKMKAVGNDGKNKLKFQNDNWNNALDMNYAKGGGTFANATTNIPDMLGPGAGGAAVAAAGFSTLYLNGGDYTHPIFPNPHRIYQFFAAQRLADLILTIRREPVTQNDVINIVAHSQGTIITMLANMLVKQAGYSPANCVILNHSPYSLESRLMENAQSGHHQTSEARQQTFKNFCAVMAEQYKGGELSGDDIEVLEGSCTLRRPEENPLRKDKRYRRNNNGKVYNYFCPNDGTVSLRNIQGFGWRGIPQNIAGNIPNLYQRVFYQHGRVGDPPDSKPFKMPSPGKGDFTYGVTTNASYTASDVIINGEELPDPFIFKLQGEDNHPDDDPKTCDIPYESYIDPASPDAYISYSAKAYAISRTEMVVFPMHKDYYPGMKPGHSLTPDEIKQLSDEKGYTVVQGNVRGMGDFRNLMLVRVRSREDLEKEWQRSDPVGYSQHSSIVMSEFAPAQAMAFDLAIGQCKAFDYKAGEFWEALLHRADWRDVHNGNPQAREYYRTGRLDTALTKDFMNKPDEVVPSLKECGVVNKYMNATTIIPSQGYLAKDYKEIPNTQWDRPDTLTDRELGITKGN